MESIAKYKIDVVGDDKNLDGVIPINHEICFTSLGFYYDGTEWCASITAYTFKDSTHDNALDNKAFPNHVFCIGLGATLPGTQDEVAFVKSKAEAEIDTYYGTGHRTLL